MFETVLEFFTFAQIRSQGLSPLSAITLSSSISLDQALQLLRALNFYPSRDQEQQIINEIRYAHRDHKSNDEDSVTLEEFIKLFVNHRPAVPLVAHDFEQCLETISSIPVVTSPVSTLNLTLD